MRCTISYKENGLREGAESGTKAIHLDSTFNSTGSSLLAKEDTHANGEARNTEVVSGAKAVVAAEKALE